MKLGRLATYGLLAGIAAGAYAWIQTTPQGKRLGAQLQRDLARGRLPLIGQVATIPQVQALTDLAAAGLRDLVERGAALVAERTAPAEPLFRDLGERAGGVSAVLATRAGQTAAALGQRAGEMVRPAAAMVERRLRRPDELAAILGERMRWQPPMPGRTGAMALAGPAFGLTTAVAALGRFGLDVVQAIVTAALWLAAIAALLILIYRPEQFRPDVFARLLAGAGNAILQAVGWLVEQARPLLAGLAPRERPGPRRVA